MSEFTTMRIGKSKFPFVQRLAIKVSPSGVALVINDWQRRFAVLAYNLQG